MRGAPGLCVVSNSTPQAASFIITGSGESVSVCAQPIDSRPAISGYRLPSNAARPDDPDNSRLALPPCRGARSHPNQIRWLAGASRTLDVPLQRHLVEAV